MDMASLMAQMQGGQGKQLDTIIIMSLYMCLPFAFSLSRRCWWHGWWRRWNGHGIIDGSDARWTRYELRHLPLEFSTYISRFLVSLGGAGAGAAAGGEGAGSNIDFEALMKQVSLDLCPV